MDVGRDGLPKLDDGVLLWLDFDGAEPEIEAVAELLALPENLPRRLLSDEKRPSLAQYDDCLHVRVVDLTNDRRRRPVALDAVAGRNWLLTIDRTGGKSAGAFRGVFKGETELGRLDSLSFLAALLEAHVGSYFAAVADVEGQLDSFDENVMRGKLAGDQAALLQLVAFRRRLAVVRRHLLEHRDVYATLCDPDLTSLGSEESAKRFQSLLGRLERAVDGAEVARQMVAGSFEILMTKTGQRTNDIMKVLTLVSAALLPSSVIAGVLGMNFKLPFFGHGDLFWVAVAVMASLMLGTVLIAWRRDWL